MRIASSSSPECHSYVIYICIYGTTTHVGGLPCVMVPWPFAPSTGTARLASPASPRPPSRARGRRASAGRLDPSSNINSRLLKPSDSLLAMVISTKTQIAHLEALGHQGDPPCEPAMHCYRRAQRSGRPQWLLEIATSESGGSNGLEQSTIITVVDIHVPPRAHTSAHP